MARKKKQSKAAIPPHIRQGLMLAAQQEQERNYRHLQFIMGLGDRFHAIALDIADWSQKTFGEDQGELATGTIKHLIRECQEILDSNDPVEYADAMILLLDGARRTGISHLQLLDEVQKKMVVNRGREWGPPDAEGVREHIEPDGPETEYEPDDPGFVGPPPGGIGSVPKTFQEVIAEQRANEIEPRNGYAH